MPDVTPIVLQHIDLDIVPGKTPPIVHVSEYDTGRNIIVNLFMDGYPFGSNSIESYTVKVEGSIGKYGFSENAAWADDAEGVVVIHLTEAMTAIHGRVWTKIKLINNGQQISTCGFWLDVDRAGVESETVISAPGFDEQIANAAAEWMAQQGFTSPTVAIAPITGGNRVTFTDVEHPQGQSIDVLNGEDGEVTNLDATLSVEGAAADAAAVGEVRDITVHAAKTVNALDIAFKSTVRESSSVDLSLGVGGNANIDDFVSGEYYRLSDGAITTGNANCSRRKAFFAVKPESTLNVDIYIIVTFYNEYKEFVSAVNTSAEGDITVPSNAYYARFSSERWNGATNSYNRNSRFGATKTNALVTDVWHETENLRIPYKSITGTEPVNNAVSSVAELDKVLPRYPVLLTHGKLAKIKHGSYYYANKLTGASGSNVAEIVFYDADKNPIPSLTTEEWGALGYSTTNATSGGIQPVSSSTPNSEVAGFLWRTWDVNTRFKVNGTTLTAYNINGNPTTATCELSAVPVYIKLLRQYSTGADYPRFTIESRNADYPDETYYVEYSEGKGVGLLEQIKSSVESGIFASVETSEFGRWMRSNAIKEANKKIHAFRIASFNIYGAAKHKSNWSAVRDALQNYGIDLIGFQEVYDPFDTLSNNGGVTFADTLVSWQLSQFSTSASNYPLNSRIVAATSGFELVGSEETVYTTQANYGQRCYVRAEFRLPRWKAKNWSDHIKISVYDTQLEVGTSTTYTNARLAQVAQLVAAMNADPNPFIILTGDFNEMATDRSTFAAIEAAGFTPVLADDSTPTSYRGYYDNIFVNDRISIVDNDVIPYSDNGSNLSDHGLLFADIVLDYSNIIAVKKVGEHCTISGIEDWLDRRQTEPVTVTITPDSGYSISAISTGQGDNDLDYSTNGAVVKNGNTITIRPNLVVGDVWISVTTN